MMRDETLDALWFATMNEPDRVMAFGRTVAAHAEERLQALIRALKTHDGDNSGREFGVAVLNFETGKPPYFLWAMQSDIDDAIEAALASPPTAPPAQAAEQAQPVAWRLRETPPDWPEPGPWIYREQSERPYCAWDHYEIEPLYATPPKAEPAASGAPIDLHAVIMNLRCNPPFNLSDEATLAYKMGHRDALLHRHAAERAAARRLSSTQRLSGRSLR